MDNWVSAAIGCIGAIIGALVAGIAQIYTTRKTIQNSQKEFSEKIDQMREDQRKEAVANATKYFNSENERFYEGLRQQILFYDRLLNELYYLNNITHPKNQERRMSIGYPHIDNNISEIVGNVSLHGRISTLLGALRSNLAMYETALVAGSASEVLEEEIDKIYKLIGAINDESFENYANAQTALREYELTRGKEKLKNTP